MSASSSGLMCLSGSSAWTSGRERQLPHALPNAASARARTAQVFVTLGITEHSVVPRIAGAARPDFLRSHLPAAARFRAADPESPSSALSVGNRCSSDARTSAEVWRSDLPTRETRSAGCARTRVANARRCLDAKHPIDVPRNRAHFLPWPPPENRAVAHRASHPASLPSNCATPERRISALARLNDGPVENGTSVTVHEFATR